MIINNGEKVHVVNVSDPGLNLELVTCRYTRDSSPIATDDNGFPLNINEFSANG